MHSEMEREFWTVDFNFDVWVCDSEFIFMVECIVFKLEDVECTILNKRVERLNKKVDLVQHNF